MYKNFQCILTSFLDSNHNQIINLRNELYINALKLNIHHTKVEFFKNGKETLRFIQVLQRIIAKGNSLRKKLVFSFKNVKVVNTRQKDLARILEFEIKEDC